MTARVATLLPAAGSWTVSGDRTRVTFTVANLGRPVQGSVGCRWGELDVDGLVCVLVFRSADDRILVVGMATGLETHLEVRDRIERTPLLPGEDPALLPGPDRVEFGRILRADVPAEVRS